MSSLPSARRTTWAARLGSGVERLRVFPKVDAVGALTARRGWLLPFALHAWWALLAGSYVFEFGRGPAISGVDASGHVSVLHLYAAHVYPHVQGWIPEFFGGMPFPVFYPPMFYWLGATLMKVTGMDATLAAKVITVASFAALPGVLFRLGRRLGLSRVESFFAACVIGVVACGRNFVALFAVGLEGLFEIGLYTHTLGFVWFCVWCGALPHARRGRASSLAAVLSLAAMLLTNVHVLPLGAAYTTFWFGLDALRVWRLKRPRRAFRLFSNSLRTVCIVVSGGLLAGVWTVPAFVWRAYALGQPQSAEGLFASLGPFLFPLLACVLVVLTESRRRPALAAMALTSLAASAVSLLPLEGFLNVPFQPWRLLCPALLLAVIPAVFLASRLLRELLRRPAYVTVCLTAGLLLCAALLPRTEYAGVSLTNRNAEEFNSIRQAMKQLPPGMTVVEILGLDKKNPAGGWSIPEQNASRALAHQLATDGRRVLWSVFREHAVSAPYATAVRNLFSTTPEKFGLGGVAVDATPATVSLDDSLSLARRLGVTYYLVRTPLQVARLKKGAGMHLMWEIGGWHLFADELRDASSFEVINSTPVIAWLPARFRNRSASDFDFFNLGESLAFRGHQELCVLWGQSGGGAGARSLSRLAGVLAVVDPSQVSVDGERWLGDVTAAAGGVKLLVLNDGSALARSLYERRHLFAAYEQVNLSDYQDSRRLLGVVAERLVEWAADDSTARPGGVKVWQTNTTYFPAWKARDASTVWLTGRGGMAVIGSDTPSLSWDASRPEAWGGLASLLGLLSGAVTVFMLPRWLKVPSGDAWAREEETTVSLG